MFRFFRSPKKVLAALILAAVACTTPLSEARAQHGCVWSNGGQTANVYTVAVYYGFEGQWHLYGRYYATVYANGATDWGGAQYAYRDIQNRGLPATYTSAFWRTTNNG